MYNTPKFSSYWIFKLRICVTFVMVYMSLFKIVHKNSDGCLLYYPFDNLLLNSIYKILRINSNNMIFLTLSSKFIVSEASVPADTDLALRTLCFLSAGFDPRILSLVGFSLTSCELKKKKTLNSLVNYPIQLSIYSILITPNCPWIFYYRIERYGENIREKVLILKLKIKV